MNLPSYLTNLGIRKPNSTEKEKIQSELLEDSHLDTSYLALTIGSCAIATLGLLSNSTAVIIGAMIVAPLMLPIRSLAFAALVGHGVLYRKSVLAIIVGTLVSVALACFLGWIVAIPEFGSEVTSRSQPTLIDLGIALAAGAIAGFAKVEPKIASSLAGTAIAVALMPPVCVIGLGISQFNWSLSIGAALLYVTNLLGITLSCMLIFLLTGFASLRLGRKALIRTAVFTGILIVPLGISFIRLAQQQQLEILIQDVLANSNTFARVEIVDSEINWLSDPPQARFDVFLTDTLTPKQVGLLENFVAEQSGQRVSLVFNVSQTREIRSSVISDN